MKSQRSARAALAATASSGILLLAGSPALAQVPLDGDPSHIVRLYDKDGDGKLGKTEQQAARDDFRAQALKQHDINGDGKLSDGERRTAIDARRLRLFDSNADGHIDEAERSAAKTSRAVRSKLELAKYDRNGDGSLDPGEREKARSEGVFVGKLRGGGPIPPQTKPATE